MTGDLFKAVHNGDFWSQESEPLLRDRDLALVECACGEEFLPKSANALLSLAFDAKGINEDCIFGQKDVPQVGVPLLKGLKSLPHYLLDGVFILRAASDLR